MKNVKRRSTSEIRNDLNGLNYLNVLNAQDLRLFVEQLAVVAPVGVGMHGFVTGAARFADHDVDVFLGNRPRRAEQTELDS